MSTGKSKLIMLEFNELSPSLMNRFISEGRLPNFRRLRDSSDLYVSEAGEEPPFLEPWIQGVTVHTGLPYAEHKVFDLDDGAKFDFPRIWDIVGGKGEKVWICGSMNTAFRKPIDGYLLPDPWSTGTKPYPEGEFDDFVNFVKTHVQEHTREAVPLGRAAQLRFLKFMMAHGMSFETVSEVISQLMLERGGTSRWKRAVILDSLQWDLFSHYWKRHQPTLSSLFLNSVAHFQHVYWRCFQPEIFSSSPSPEDLKEYGDAVRFGYEHMDRIVGKCLDMCGKETSVALITGLSQQPCLKYEDSGGKVFYRIADTDSFFARLKLARCQYAPVMSEEFHLYFATDQDAEDADRKLSSLELNGRQVLKLRRTGREIFAGCSLFDRVDRGAMVNSCAGSFRFFEQFYDCNIVKSGMHHPDGIFWVHHAGQETSSSWIERVPLIDVAPTLLSLCGHEPPHFMKGRILKRKTTNAAAHAAVADA